MMFFRTIWKLVLHTKIFGGKYFIPAFGFLFLSMFRILYRNNKCISRSELQNVFLKAWGQKWIQICPGQAL